MFGMSWFSIASAVFRFLGGDTAKSLLAAYQAHLTANNNDHKIAADLAAQEVTAQTAETQAVTQLKIAQIGHPWEVEKLFAYVTLSYYAKLLIWDKVIGSLAGYTESIFVIDPLRSYDAIWGGMIISYYFAKRGFENIMQILKR